MSGDGLKEVNTNGGGATSEGGRSRSDPRHPDYFKTPKALKKRRSKMVAPFTNRRAPLIEVEPPSPGGTRYERRFAVGLGCEIKVKVDDSQRSMVDRSAGSNGDSPPSENTRRLANHVQSRPPSSSTKSLKFLPPSSTSSSPDLSPSNGSKSFASPEPTPSMPYGHSSAEKIMWPTPPAGPEDAEQVSSAAPRSHRGRRRALETPAGAVARPHATPFEAMPYGHSSAEKKMWPTVKIKRRRVRSPDRGPVPNLLPFTPAPDKPSPEESTSLQSSTAASQSTSSNDSSSVSHVSEEKSKIPPKVPGTPTTSDNKTETSKNKKRKLSDEERAEKEKRREARRKRRKARRTLVPPATTTINVPPFPFEAITKFGDDETPWDESDSRADKFPKLINHWADKVNAAMSETYGEESTVLGGVFTRGVRLTMERVTSAMTIVADQIRANDAAEEAATSAAEEALMKEHKAKRPGCESSAEDELAVVRGETEIYRRLEEKYRNEAKQLEKVKADFLEAERESARIAREKAAAEPSELDTPTKELVRRTDEVIDAAPGLLMAAHWDELVEADHRDRQLGELDFELARVSLKEEEMVVKISALDGLGEEKVSGDVILGLRTPSTPGCLRDDMSRFSICSKSSFFSPAEFHVPATPLPHSSKAPPGSSTRAIPSAHPSGGPSVANSRHSSSYSVRAKPPSTGGSSEFATPSGSLVRSNRSSKSSAG